MSLENDFVQELSTGILYPRQLHGLVLIGCGVRMKFGFIKGYAVGTYIDNTTRDALKSTSAVDDDIHKVLLDPNYRRILRIVMNRTVPIDMFNSSIIDALTPRMNGKDVDQIHKFKELGPYRDLEEGDIIELSIQGDTMEYSNSLGGIGEIKSMIFTRAICDAYYGNDCVSPTHKEAVLRYISSIK